MFLNSRAATSGEGNNTDGILRALMTIGFPVSLLLRLLKCLGAADLLYMRLERGKLVFEAWLSPEPVDNRFSGKPWFLRHSRFSARITRSPYAVGLRYEGIESMKWYQVGGVGYECKSEGIPELNCSLSSINARR